MVLGRRQWIIVTLTLILLVFLTACERPLGSNESETAEQAAEATAVAETAEDEAAADGASEEEASSMTESEAESAESAPEEADSDEAVSSDPEAGGGTPEMAADATTNEDQAADEAATGEDMTEEAAAEDAMAEVDGEAAQEESAGEETGAATEEVATADTTETEAADSDVAETEEDMAAEQATTPDAPTRPATHTVAAGENLYRIGLKYGLSWVVLAAYNNLPNADYIRVGQVLQIPGGAVPGPAPSPTPPDESGHIDYVVQRGDTLNKIGQKFGVSWVEIAEANGLINPNLIYAGQVLKIPTTKPDVPPATTHTVKSGETLYRISLQYGAHWLAIAQVNNIAPPYVIYPGQVLTLPGG